MKPGHKIYNAMESSKEDNLIRSLFSKIPLDDVSGDFTLRVMEQVTADPVIQRAERNYFEWWWVAVSLVVILALYVTGVGSWVVLQMKPWMELAYIEVVSLFSIITGMFPSIIVEIPSAPLFSLIVAAIILVLLIDLPLRLQFRSN